MTLAIKRIHNLPPHLSYVSTLPDISGIARGGFKPAIRIEAVFFTAVKSLLLNIITSLTTRRTINSQFAQNQPFGASGAIASMVECVLTWVREQYLVVTLQNEPFCALLFIFNQ